MSFPLVEILVYLAIGVGVATLFELKDPDGRDNMPIVLFWPAAVLSMLPVLLAYLLRKYIIGGR